MYRDRLKYIREELEINQETVAKLLKVHRGSYSKYETENAIMPIKHLNFLCNYFNVSLDFIFNFTNKRNYENSRDYIDLNKCSLRLKFLRKEAKLTQEQLAKIIGTAKTTISGYERKANIIATPFLYDICKKYNISADYLLGKTDTPKYYK